MMKDFIICILATSLTGMILKYRIDIELRLENKYNQGYESGYREAKLIYECDHDRTECEIIKDSIDAN